MAERLDDSHDAPKGLPGNDDRLVSDISERYPEALSANVGDDQPGSEMMTTKVKLADTTSVFPQSMA